MREQWTDYELPRSIKINGNVYKFKSDFRDILKVFEPLNDPDLMDIEKIDCALSQFYIDYDKIKERPNDFNDLVESMWLFINGNKNDLTSKKQKPLMDWEKDLSLIIAPINKACGKEIRSMKYMHWWTFLSYFMEIGDCTFSTFVSIRNKKNKGKKLEKFEEEIYKNNVEAITLRKRVDATTQELIDELLGKR